MGTKPGIALISVVLTGIMLSGCESCGACRASKLWGQDKATVSAGQSNNPNGYPASWANQPRTIPGSPLASAGSALPANQSARITDPGLNSGAMTSSLNSASNQPAAPTLPTNATDARFPTPSQIPASFPGNERPSHSWVTWEQQVDCWLSSRRRSWLPNSGRDQ